MSLPDFYALLTHAGESSYANAMASLEKWKFTHMAVGDGTGVGAQGTPVPDKNSVDLVSQRDQFALNQLYKHPSAPGQVIAEIIIPADVGDWWIREIGLKNSDGQLLVVANCPPSFKPKLESGAGKSQVVRIVFKVTDPDSVELITDPSTVIATREFVEDCLIEVTEALATEQQARMLADSQLSNALAAESQTRQINDTQLSQQINNGLATKLDKDDPSVTNAREWTATTVSQAEAEAGKATTPRKWTALRILQAILAALKWENIQDKPDQATRWPTWAEVTSKPATMPPSAHSHAWSEVTGKPSTFTPAAHTHAWGDLSGVPAQATRWPTWGEVSGKPATMPPSAHTHTTGTKANNGYMKLDNGMIIQWGKVYITTNGTRFNFPTAFPSICTSLVTMGMDDAAGGELMNPKTVDRSGFLANASFTANYYYIAIGY